jgi:hypothetical protein
MLAHRIAFAGAMAVLAAPARSVGVKWSPGDRTVAGGARHGDTSEHRREAEPERREGASRHLAPTLLATSEGDAGVGVPLRGANASSARTRMDTAGCSSRRRR